MGMKKLFGGLLEGVGGELGQPDLVKKVTEGIAKLARHADRGLPVLPREVEIHVKVGQGSVQVVERFVEDPAFDKEVEARLLNELVRLRPEGLPLRRYFVEASDRTAVEVREAPLRKYKLRIEGGDRDGSAVTLPQGRRDFLLGRGEWHGDAPEIVNDVVLAENEKALSRRAARLHRSSYGLELESLDQQEALVVVRPDGERVRPVLASNGRVVVGPGDVIEFTDGKKPVICVRIEEE
jgi:hypothetical protein